MEGVTQSTYDAYRKQHGLVPQDVRNISKGEVHDIYQNQYWNASGSNKLSGPLADIVFDVAVNSGVHTAQQMLQRARQQNPGADDKTLARNIVDQQRQHYVNIANARPDKRKFLNGWMRRINDLNAHIGQ